MLFPLKDTEVIPQYSWLLLHDADTHSEIIYDDVIITKNNWCLIIK